MGIRPQRHHENIEHVATHLDTGPYGVEGETDSELVFRWMLNRIESCPSERPRDGVHH
jgi:hypothetical protein